VYILTTAGPAILVRTVTEEGATGVNVNFAGDGYDVWYSADDFRRIPGGSKVSQHFMPEIFYLLLACSISLILLDYNLLYPI